MLRLAATTAWSHKRRLLGSALAIVLGVSFLCATLVLGDSARAGFEVAFGEATAGIDAAVRSDRELTGTDEASRAPIDAALLDEVRAVDGVTAAVPTVEGSAQVLDASGDPIGGQGPPTMAAAWIDDPALTGWDLAEGRAPRAAGEVVVDAASAEDAEVGVGDPLQVLVPEPLTMTVVGIATFGDDDSIGGSTYLGFALPVAQDLLLGSRDRISGVAAAAADGVSEAELVRNIGEVLPAGVEALTGTSLAEEMEDDIEGDFLGFFSTALQAFALVALLVASFSIFNTFSILAAQRTRESALLRAIGASRRQLLSAALVESVVVGAVGAALGAAAGIGIASLALDLLGSAGFGLPVDGVVVSSGSVVPAAVIGLAVTVASGLVPAWRASRVAPLAALREVAVDASGGSRLRAVAGVLITGLGAGIVASGGQGAVERVGLGGVITLVGVVVLGPVVARPVGHLLGAPLRVRGVSGDLARRNAVRNPRRTAATATALLVGVGVVSLFTVFGASISGSIEDQVDKTFGGELALTPRGREVSGSGLPVGIADRVAGLDEVRAAAGLGYGGAVVDGRHEDVGFTDPVAIAQVADLDVLDGELGAVGPEGIAFAHDYAEEHGYEVGDPVEVELADGSVEQLAVGAVFDASAIGGDVLLHQDLWVEHTAQVAHYLVLVGLADGTSLEEGRAAVEASTAGPGAPEVMDREQFIADQAAEVDALLTVVYALLAVAILIALMGIANTISLSVHERTRELGLLRAVGQTRRQLRSMVRWESVIVAVFGTAGGLGLGLFLSWGLVRSLNAEEGWATYVIPVGSLATVLAVGAAAGVLAGLRPARRASRLDVLAAVAAD